jgi:hypothetical protein
MLMDEQQQRRLNVATGHTASRNRIADSNNNNNNNNNNDNDNDDPPASCSSGRVRARGDDADDALVVDDHDPDAGSSRSFSMCLTFVRLYR